MNTLKEEIEQIYSRKPEELGKTEFELFEQFKSLLNSGEIRSAEKIDGEWQVNRWVKKGILLGFRLGKLVDCSIDEQFRFFDKSTYPLKKIQIEDKIRQVPGGSSIRDGAYVAPGVVIMPPAYINVGAYVDEETMVDSHALVGSCAQIGKRVHLSASAQIGGVLEPIGSMPVIIEDNVLVGGNCGIYEGALVCENAVIGAGTILTGSMPVYDLVSETVIRKSENTPLTIPAGAVVVPGSRPVKGAFAESHTLSIYSPLIVKYRDEKTSATTALEESLR
ncbi:2,3,4,5-tetrahydropyridine-2,6-dicarboxylate N-succinyltransferase [candidate division KSB1 bacterium]|nr:2,3,4,5-tetrahydropyridine-2,6-dicarboxylate N-succinyltransferase [candidate division KSB1 bacterium]